MKLTESQQQAFFAHVLSEYPKEAVGAIVDGKYLPLVNIHPDPEREFKVDPLELFCLDVKAVLHSHPYPPGTMPEDRHYKFEWPSSSDMKTWITWDVPFGIVSTDGTGCSEMLWMDDDDLRPLIGRDFDHGVADCYSIIRDYFWLEKGIRLKNYARQWKWWERGQSLYRDYFEDAGFAEIPIHEAKPGDALIYQIYSNTPNHAAVMLDGGLILHHLIGKKSTYDTQARWKRFEAMAVRYQRNPAK